MDIDGDTIRRLAALMDETGLSEIEVEEDGKRLRVARGGMQVFAGAPAAVGPAPASAPSAPEAPDPADHPGAVISPMVGTAYLQPEPGAAPFAAVGAQVREGETIFIIEAMKVMNPIKAPRSGTVKAVLVEDAQPVEYGEVLALIE